MIIWYLCQFEIEYAHQFAATNRGAVRFSARCRVIFSFQLVR